MIYVVWLTLLALFIFSFIFKVSIWVPIIAWLLVVLVRIKEKIGNYNDWKKINDRDENIKLKEKAEDMAQRGLAFSSTRNDEEKKIVESFKYERRKQKRKFENDLINSLFLK
jgi:hypothetical protein